MAKIKRRMVRVFKEEFGSGKNSGIGRRRVISMSKIRNRIANKKNCTEKGFREVKSWVKPHSKGRRS